MARYYDLDSLRVSDINVGTVMFPKMERCILLRDIESAPTADVAPKSKVALDVIRKVKNKVRKYKQNTLNPYEHIILYLNELEKKYTEGEK